MSTATLFAWIFSSSMALAQAGFLEVARDHGVTVWRREGGGAIELAAEGIINAPPAQVRAVLLDYEHHGCWLKELRESRVLVRDPHSLIVYQRLGLPVIADRDFTLKVNWGEDGDVLWLAFRAANELGPPPEKHVVRVMVHEGGWRLEPVDAGRQTRARYHFRLDLAGSLPAWMARGRAAKDVPGLFQSIRAQVPNYSAR
jgi:hypothetical protein